MEKRKGITKEELAALLDAEKPPLPKKPTKAELEKQKHDEECKDNKQCHKKVYNLHEPVYEIEEDESDSSGSEMEFKIPRPPKFMNLAGLTFDLNLPKDEPLIPIPDPNKPEYDIRRFYYSGFERSPPRSPPKKLSREEQQSLYAEQIASGEQFSCTVEGAQNDMSFDNRFPDYLGLDSNELSFIDPIFPPKGDYSLKGLILNLGSSSASDETKENISENIDVDEQSSTSTFVSSTLNFFQSTSNLCSTQGSTTSKSDIVTPKSEPIIQPLAPQLDPYSSKSVPLVPKEEEPVSTESLFSTFDPGSFPDFPSISRKKRFIPKYEPSQPKSFSSILKNEPLASEQSVPNFDPSSSIDFPPISKNEPKITKSLPSISIFDQGYSKTLSSIVEKDSLAKNKPPTPNFDPSSSIDFPSIPGKEASASKSDPIISKSRRHSRKSFKLPKRKPLTATPPPSENIPSSWEELEAPKLDVPGLKDEPSVFKSGTSIQNDPIQLQGLPSTCKSEPSIPQFDTYSSKDFPSILENEASKAKWPSKVLKSGKRRSKNNRFSKKKSCAKYDPSASSDSPSITKKKRTTASSQIPTSIRDQISMKIIQTLKEGITASLEDIASPKPDISTWQEELLSTPEEIASPRSEVLNLKEELLSTPEEIASLRSDGPILKEELLSTPEEIASPRSDGPTLKEELPCTSEGITSPTSDVPTLKEVLPCTSEDTASPRHVPTLIEEHPFTSVYLALLRCYLPALEKKLPRTSEDIASPSSDLPTLKDEPPYTSKDIAPPKPDLPTLQEELPYTSQNLASPSFDLNTLKEERPFTSKYLASLRSYLTTVKEELPSTSQNLASPSSDLTTLKEERPFTSKYLASLRSYPTIVKEESPSTSKDIVSLSCDPSTLDDELLSSQSQSSASKDNFDSTSKFETSTSNDQIPMSKLDDEVQLKEDPSIPESKFSVSKSESSIPKLDPCSSQDIPSIPENKPVTSKSQPLTSKSPKRAWKDYKLLKRKPSVIKIQNQGTSSKNYPSSPSASKMKPHTVEIQSSTLKEDPCPVKNVASPAEDVPVSWEDLASPRFDETSSTSEKVPCSMKESAALSKIESPILKDKTSISKSLLSISESESSASKIKTSFEPCLPMSKSQPPISKSPKRAWKDYKLSKRKPTTKTQTSSPECEPKDVLPTSKIEPCTANNEPTSSIDVPIPAEDVPSSWEDLASPRFDPPLESQPSSSKSDPSILKDELTSTLEALFSEAGVDDPILEDEPPISIKDLWICPSTSKDDPLVASGQLFLPQLNPVHFRTLMAFLNDEPLSPRSETSVTKSDSSSSKNESSKSETSISKVVPSSWKDFPTKSLTSASEPSISKSGKRPWQDYKLWKRKSSTNKDESDPTDLSHKSLNEPCSSKDIPRPEEIPSSWEDLASPRFDIYTSKDESSTSQSQPSASKEKPSTSKSEPSPYDFDFDPKYEPFLPFLYVPLKKKDSPTECHCPPSSTKSGSSTSYEETDNLRQVSTEIIERAFKVMDNPYYVDNDFRLPQPPNYKIGENPWEVVENGHSASNAAFKRYYEHIDDPPCTLLEMLERQELMDDETSPYRLNNIALFKDIKEMPTDEQIKETSESTGIPFDELKELYFAVIENNLIRETLLQMTIQNALTNVNPISKFKTYEEYIAAEKKFIEHAVALELYNLSMEALYNSKIVRVHPSCEEKLRMYFENEFTKMDSHQVPSSVESDVLSEPPFTYGDCESQAIGPQHMNWVAVNAAKEIGRPIAVFDAKDFNPEFNTEPLWIDPDFDFEAPIKHKHNFMVCAHFDSADEAALLDKSFAEENILISKEQQTSKFTAKHILDYRKERKIKPSKEDLPSENLPQDEDLPIDNLSPEEDLPPEENLSSKEELPPEEDLSSAKKDDDIPIEAEVNQNEEPKEEIPENEPEYIPRCPTEYEPQFQAQCLQLFGPQYRLQQLNQYEQQYQAQYPLQNQAPYQAQYPQEYPPQFQPRYHSEYQQRGQIQYQQPQYPTEFVQDPSQYLAQYPLQYQPEYQNEFQPRDQSKYRQQDRSQYKPRGKSKYKPKKQSQYQQEDPYPPDYQYPPENQQQYQSEYRRYDQHDQQYDPQYDPRYDPQYDPNFDLQYDPRYYGHYDPQYDPHYDPQYDPQYYGQYDPEYNPNYDPQYEEQYQPKFPSQYAPCQSDEERCRLLNQTLYKAPIYTHKIPGGMPQVSFQGTMLYPIKEERDLEDEEEEKWLLALAEERELQEEEEGKWDLDFTELSPTSSLLLDSNSESDLGTPTGDHLLTESLIIESSNAPLPYVGEPRPPSPPLPMPPPFPIPPPPPLPPGETSIETYATKLKKSLSATDIHIGDAIPKMISVKSEPSSPPKLTVEPSESGDAGIITNLEITIASSEVSSPKSAGTLSRRQKRKARRAEQLRRREELDKEEPEEEPRRRKVTFRYPEATVFILPTSPTPPTKVQDRTPKKQGNQSQLKSALKKGDSKRDKHKHERKK